MGQIVAWNDIEFSLGGSSLNAVEDIEITGSCETEDSETDGEKYVKRKNAKPYEIEMKAILDARLSVDVQKMATKMTEAARKSTKGYFYSGSAKLFPCKFMMVEAIISKIVMNPKGKWLSCEVDMKLMQSTKYDGTTKSKSSSSGGGGSSSSKKSSTKSTSTKTSSSSDVDVVSMAAPSTSKSSTTTTRVSMTGVSAKSIAAVAASRAATNSAKNTSASSSSSKTSSTIKKV